MIKKISADYTIPSEPFWKIRQSEDLYIEVDSSGNAVNIFLPNIVSDLFSALNLKIYITDTGRNASVNAINVVTQGGDTFSPSGNTLSITTDGAAVKVEVGTQTTWLWETTNSGGGGGSSTVSFSISAAQTAGGTYTDARLVGKTPVTDFSVFSNEGDGGVLKYPDAYTFVSGTGTITFIGGAGNYYIQIYS